MSAPDAVAPDATDAPERADPERARRLAGRAPLVVVIDDDRAFLDSTRFLLESLGHATLGCTDPDEALAVLADAPIERPVCALLDVRMPHMSGLDLHDALNERAPHLPVVYMTGHGDVPLAVEAMKKGAMTFLEKPLDDVRLEEALALAFDPVRQARRVPAERVDALAAARALETGLSPRERQIVALMRLELSSADIAERLSISVKTVEFHRTKLCRRFGVRNTAVLMRLLADLHGADPT